MPLSERITLIAVLLLFAVSVFGGLFSKKGIVLDIEIKNDETTNGEFEKEYLPKLDKNAYPTMHIYPSMIINPMTLYKFIEQLNKTKHQNPLRACTFCHMSKVVNYCMTMPISYDTVKQILILNFCKDVLEICDKITNTVHC